MATSPKRAGFLKEKETSKERKRKERKRRESKGKSIHSFNKCLITAYYVFGICKKQGIQWMKIGKILIFLELIMQLRSQVLSNNTKDTKVAIVMYDKNNFPWKF